MSKKLFLSTNVIILFVFDLSKLFERIFDLMTSLNYTLLANRLIIITRYFLFFVSLACSFEISN
jgi:hypothetical protein